MQIENCHNPVTGNKNPFFKPDSPPDVCPMNMYRTGGDIGAGWGSIIGEVYSLVQYGDSPTPHSHPGCCEWCPAFVWRGTAMTTRREAAARLTYLLVQL